MYCYRNLLHAAWLEKRRCSRTGCPPSALTTGSVARSELGDLTVSMAIDASPLVVGGRRRRRGILLILLHVMCNESFENDPVVSEPTLHASATTLSLLWSFIGTSSSESLDCKSPRICCISLALNWYSSSEWNIWILVDLQCRVLLSFEVVIFNCVPRLFLWSMKRGFIMLIQKLSFLRILCSVSLISSRCVLDGERNFNYSDERKKFVSSRSFIIGVMYTAYLTARVTLI